MLYERYKGEFASRAGVLWTVKIMQEADKAFTSIGELEFPAEEPLVIEWGDTGKEDSIASSAATLTLISPGDRTYENLYTIAVGQIRLDVYRNGQLYWSGTLDPEFYEEPYATAGGYEVTITFSDFGILDRLKYNLTGIHTGQTILEHMLAQSRILHEEVKNLSGTCIRWTDENHVMQYLYGLEAVKLRSDNFYDEDGEACTMREVLEGMLQPLALRIQQKNGRIWVYDLHTAFNNLPQTAVQWMGSDQVMGVDRVLNNVKVTLNTYADSELMTDTLTCPGEYDENRTEIAHPTVVTTANNCFSFYPDYSKERVDGNLDYANLDFTIFLFAPWWETAQETELDMLNSEAYYFHQLPLLGNASETDGVLAFMQTGGHGSLTQGWSSPIGITPAQPTDEVLMRSQRIYLPALDEADATAYNLRLTLDMMVDARYNPYNQADDNNEKGNYNRQEEWLNYVMVPVAVTLYDEQGNALIHYDNTAIAHSNDKTPHYSLKYLKGEWKSGAATFGKCWLEWYNPEDRTKKSAVAGWGKNRHNIGLTTQDMYDSFKKLPEGEYIPYPTKGGYLEICVYKGFYGWNYGNKFDTPLASTDAVYKNVRWHTYKAPKVEVVRTDFMKNTVQTDDVEYNSYINTAAKEELKIDTICGTMAKPCPTAKALMINARTNMVLSAMRRAERTAQVERLLMGTLYSQFADRKIRLSGTAAINEGNLTLYTETMQAGKRFICLADVQDLQADESEISIVELRPDEYDENIMN